MQSPAWFWSGAENAKSQGIPWDPIGSHGIPWDPMGSHGIPWDPMGSHGMPWDPMGSHGMPWDPMGSHGIPWDFAFSAPLQNHAGDCTYISPRLLLKWTRLCIWILFTSPLPLATPMGSHEIPWDHRTSPSMSNISQNHPGTIPETHMTWL